MPSSDKVKTTILLDKTVKKLAQVHAIQNDMSLGKLIEEALKKVILP
jgi:predicted HicB family RNase H-like nuclease